MEITFKDRLLFFLNYLKIGQTKFESYTGLVRGSISKIKDGMSAPNLAKIAKNYPQLSIDWLITGQGEMLKPTENNSRNVHNEGSISGSVSTGDNHTSINGGLSVGNDNTSKLSDNEQRILLLEEKVLHLEEMLKEKERFIQVLLANK